MIHVSFQLTVLFLRKYFTDNNILIDFLILKVIYLSLIVFPLTKILPSVDLDTSVERI